MPPVSQEKASQFEPTRPRVAFGTRTLDARERRAEPPRAPALPNGELEAKAEHREYVRSREALERRSMLRGLILLALVLLLIGLIRAGADRVFPHGWLRQW